MPFYAVARGRKTGVFDNWVVTKRMVTGVSRALYKKFNHLEDAERFLDENSDRPRTVGDSQETKPFICIGPIIGPTITTPTSIPEVIQGSDPDSWPKMEISEFETFVESPKHKKPSFSIEKLISQEVYVDGGARGNGSPNAVGGYGVYFRSSHPSSAVSFANTTRDYRYPTNQLMEIFAMRDALSQIYNSLHKCANHLDIYTIYTDSQYTINCVTSWYKRWEENGWKNASGHPVVNASHIKECLELIDAIDYTYSFFSRKLRFVHVRGHAGNIGNENADQLANIGMDEDQAIRFN